MLLLIRLPRVQSERGFTLLELIVVCALIGIMLSLSFPSMRLSFFSDPLKSTARNLIGMVNGVRELAVRHQQPYLIHVSEAERRIWYEMENHAEIDERKTLGKQEVLLPETINISEMWIGDVELLEDQKAMWINKHGYIQWTRMRLEDEKGRHLDIQFFPFIDSVTIAE